MKKLLLGLFFLSTFLLSASFRPVWASTTRLKAWSEHLSSTASKQSWLMKYPVDPNPTAKGVPNEYCKIRLPTDSEKTDFLNFCLGEDDGHLVDFSPEYAINNCKKWAEDYINGLPNCPTPTPDKIKILPTNSPTQSPTISPTTTPTPTLIPTPTPKKEPFSIVASLNSNSLLREIIISLLTSGITIVVYHFATKRRQKRI